MDLCPFYFPLENLELEMHGIELETFYVQGPVLCHRATALSQQGAETAIQVQNVEKFGHNALKGKRKRPY